MLSITITHLCHAWKDPATEKQAVGTQYFARFEFEISFAVVYNSSTAPRGCFMLVWSTYSHQSPKTKYHIIMCNITRKTLNSYVWYWNWMHYLCCTILRFSVNMSVSFSMRKIVEITSGLSNMILSYKTLKLIKKFFLLNCCIKPTWKRGWVFHIGPIY